MSSDAAPGSPAQATEEQVQTTESTWRHLREVFQRLFPTPGAKAEAAGLALVMASVPVMEMLVIRMFTHLITTGAETAQRDTGAILRSGALFFVLFAVARVVHHVVKVVRISVFRRRFEKSLADRNRAQESWDWAMALELSNQMVGVVQILALAILIAVLDLVTGAVNAVSTVAVMALITYLFARHLALQRDYVAMGNKPGTVSVGERIDTRIRTSELGGIVGSLGMVVTLVAVLYRAVQGEIAVGDAVVFLLACRIAYGQVGHLSSSMMRFARASARANSIRSRPAREAPTPQQLQQAVPPAKAPTWLIAAGQRGDSAMIERIIDKLSSEARSGEAVVSAKIAAEAFAAYMSTYPSSSPVPLAWWTKPMPGNVGDWMSPLVVSRQARSDVSYVSPTSGSSEPHLLAIGSLARLITPASVVVGTGISSTSHPMAPDATYVSLRGPISASHLAKNGGPTVERWGDPGVLLRRLVPIEREPNGRIALVRHFLHAGAAVTLPDGVDELTMMRSHPDDVRSFLESLVAHDVVLTSSLPVLVACQSYGVPCGFVTFEGLGTARADGPLKIEDYALGADVPVLDEIPELPLDLSGTDLRSLARDVRVGDTKLDEVAEALDDAVSTVRELLALQEADDEEDGL